MSGLAAATSLSLNDEPSQLMNKASFSLAETDADWEDMSEHTMMLANTDTDTIAEDIANDLVNDDSQSAAPAPMGLAQSEALKKGLMSRIKNRGRP